MTSADRVASQWILNRQASEPLHLQKWFDDTERLANQAAAGIRATRVAPFEKTIRDAIENVGGFIARKVDLVWGFNGDMYLDLDLVIVVPGDLTDEDAAYELEKVLGEKLDFKRSSHIEGKPRGWNFYGRVAH